MIAYCRKNMVYAEQYMEELPEGSAARTFYEIPFGLAKATIDIIERGG